jgi:hypothetical protein
MGNCENCVFWEAITGGYRIYEGYCHRYPPKICLNGGIVWPKLPDVEWCGEFQKKDNTNE